MIRVKHLCDAVDEDDGDRIWIEPVGLTRDLIEWCRIDHVMTMLGPSKELGTWFSEHPDCFDFFETHYLEELQFSEYLISMLGLAFAGATRTFTLVHHGDDPKHNSATVFRSFLGDLSPSVPPQQ